VTPNAARNISRQTVTPPSAASIFPSEMLDREYIWQHQARLGSADNGFTAGPNNPLSPNL
jgi:hypothetical protein